VAAVFSVPNNVSIKLLYVDIRGHRPTDSDDCSTRTVSQETRSTRNS